MCREEKEKFNIWQAWLNLENIYGSPTPDEAVTRLFQKALPYCNAKKLYLALLDILERTDKVSSLSAYLLPCLCWQQKHKSLSLSSLSIFKFEV